MSLVPKNNGGARTRTPTIRVTDDEDARIQAAADASGHSKATFMRLAVMAAVAEHEATKPKRKGKATR